MSDIIAICEFVAKGHEEVIDRAKSIESKLAGINTAKSAEVKFTASGVDKVEGAVSSIKQRLATLAQGGDLARMLSTGIEQALREAGEGAGTALAGGLGGALGASLAGAFGGLVVSAVPGLSGFLKHLGEENDTEASVLSGAVGPEEREKYDRILARERVQWGGVGPGASAYEKKLNKFQDINYSPEKAEEALNRLGVISAGGGGNFEDMADKYAAMEKSHSPRARLALAQSSPAIMERLREMFPKYAAGGDDEQGLVPAIQRGEIGTKDMEEATRRAAENQRVKQRYEDAKGTLNPMRGSFWSKAGAEIWNFVTHPIDTFSKEGKGGQQLVGVGPDGTESQPWAAHPELAHQQKEYSFTSLSGLAEKMQQEAGGGGDVQDQQLTTLQQIAENTKKEDNSKHPGGEQNHPVAP